MARKTYSAENVAPVVYNTHDTGNLNSRMPCDFSAGIRLFLFFSQFT